MLYGLTMTYCNYHYNMMAPAITVMMIHHAVHFVYLTSKGNRRGKPMKTSYYANRRNERNRVYNDLAWEVEEREMSRRSGARPSSYRSVNLTSEIESYLNELY